MKIFTLKFMAAAMGALFLISCQSSSDLTSSSILKKRRYTKGYHWNVKSPHLDKSREVRASATEEAPRLAERETQSHVIDTEVAVASVEREAPVIEERVVEQPASESTADAWTRAVEKNPATQDQPETRAINERTESPRTQSGMRMPRGPAAVGTPVAATPSGGSMVLYIILAILIPPLAVGLLYGISTEFWISLILTILFFIPGMIYSLIVVLGY